MTARATLLQRLLVGVGGTALLVAMSVDALAVVGRHTGLPLLGSIEIVQAAVLVSGATALLIATLAGVHARVHLVVDRLPPRLARALQRVSLGLAALLYGALLAASVWIARDLWDGQEASELLSLPYRPLRVFTALAAAAVAASFAMQALRGTRR